SENRGLWQVAGNADGVRGSRQVKPFATGAPVASASRTLKRTFAQTGIPRTTVHRSGPAVSATFSTGLVLAERHASVIRPASATVTSVRPSGWARLPRLHGNRAI